MNDSIREDDLAITNPGLDVNLVQTVQDVTNFSSNPHIAMILQDMQRDQARDIWCFEGPIAIRSLLHQFLGQTLDYKSCAWDFLRHVDWIS